MEHAGSKAQRSNLPPTAEATQTEIRHTHSAGRWIEVKSWLFALPHLLVVGALTTAIWASSADGSAGGLSLLGILVLIAAVILLFTGVYRLGLFNLLMGFNRWIYRVAAYAALMTDVYPPFRLDQGPLDARSDLRAGATS